MIKTKITFEQFCTHQGKNITMEKIMFSDGTHIIRCANYNCENNGTECKNKLIKNN